MLLNPQHGIYKNCLLNAANSFSGLIKAKMGLECWYEGETNIITFWLWARVSLNYVFFLESWGTRIRHGAIDVSCFYLCGPATTVGDQEVMKRKDSLWNSMILLLMKERLGSWCLEKTKQKLNLCVQLCNLVNTSKLNSYYKKKLDGIK